MTLESLKRHFNRRAGAGPHPTWHWHQKGRGYPRIKYMLYFNSFSRDFRLIRLAKTARGRDWIAVERGIADKRLEVFRQTLSNTEVALCTALAVEHGMFMA